MDEVIFEEFKGTGNMELRLDRRAGRAAHLPGDRRRRLVAPATRSCCSTATSSSRSGSCAGCSTRRRGTAPGLELLIDKLRTTKSNDEFLAEIAKAPTPGCDLTATGSAHRRPAPFWRRRRLPVRLEHIMKTDIHPDYVECQVHCSCGNEFTTRSTGPDAARRALLRVPPLLHGQAEAGRHRWPRRALRAPVREGQDRREEGVDASRMPGAEPRYMGGQAVSKA